MLRRRELGVLGLSTAAILASKTALQAADEKEHDAHGEHFEKCAKACDDCQRECDSCANHCAHQLANGKKDHHTTLQTCLDCADACAAAARIVARKGPFSALICKACAEACAKCAAECEKFKGDEHMARCAKECRACEKACKEMLQHA